MLADIDLTPPVIASLWNGSVNYSIGDYYADADAKKVFRCVGHITEKNPAKPLETQAVLCRANFASVAGYSGWTDVTSTAPYST